MKDKGKDLRISPEIPLNRERQRKMYIQVHNN